MPKQGSRKKRAGCRVEPLDTKRSDKRCAVLVDGSRYCVAPTALGALPEELQDDLKAAIDTWVDLWPRNSLKGMFHGWDASEFKGRYTDCFVFKRTHNRARYRLYGFLTHPCPTKPRLVAFVAVLTTTKTENPTDETDLKLCLAARDDQDVQAALEEYGKTLK